MSNIQSGTIYHKGDLTEILHESERFIVGIYDGNIEYFWKKECEHDGDKFIGIVPFDTYHTCPAGLLDLFEEIARGK